MLPTAWQTRSRDDQAEGAGRPSGAQHRLEAEHRPVARPPHAERHDPKRIAGAKTWKRASMSRPSTSAPAIAADETVKTIATRDDRADRDHARALALGERLELVAGRSLRLLGWRRGLGLAARSRRSGRRRSLGGSAAGSAALDRRGAALGAALLTLLALGSLALAAAISSPTLAVGGGVERVDERRGGRSRVLGVADRPDDDDSRGSRRGTSATLPASIPPIANHGHARRPRRLRGSARGRSPAPRLRRRLPDRADADVVGRAARRRPPRSARGCGWRGR